MPAQSRREFIGTLGAAALVPLARSIERPFLRSATPFGASAPHRFKIRTITAGVTTDGSSIEPLRKAIAMLHDARARIEAAGFVVEGVRVTTSPLVADAPGSARQDLLSKLQAFDQLLTQEKVGGCIGPVLRVDRYDPELPEWLVALVHATRRFNCSLMIATPDGGVMRQAAKTASEAILALAHADPGGSANFRFAAVASMPPGSPFFPGGYHDGAPSFSIGIEGANVVHDAFADASDAAAAESRLRDTMNEEYAPIEKAALEIASESGYAYLGIDSSPAPSAQASIAAALEALIHAPFGSAGTVQACAAVTAAIKSLRVRTCGYSGLMLPVLEDPLLASRATEGRYGLRELLLYSSICGTGLDTVPIPGDTPAARIASVLEDVATMAMRLHKPLSARLFPAIGKAAGDRVQFQDSSLAPSVVFELK